MARLIKAEDAAKWIRTISEQARPGELDCRGHLAWDNLTAAMKDCIGYCPTVDAVEVVRCKECMWARPKDHREPTDTPRELICQCAHHHPIPAPWHARTAVNPDDFCSYGERKDND